MKRVLVGTHILPDDSAEAGQPKKANAANLVNEETLTAEHGLANALTLVLLSDALGAGEEAVLADRPRVLAGQTDARDVAQHRRREEQLSGTREVGRGYLPAGHELLHGELDGALEGDGGRHGDHGTRFGLQGASHRQLDRQDGVAVPVADAVAAAVEGADIIDRHARANEVAGLRRAGAEVRGVASVQGLLLLMLLLLGRVLIGVVFFGVARRWGELLLLLVLLLCGLR